MYVERIIELIIFCLVYFLFHTILIPLNLWAKDSRLQSLGVRREFIWLLSYIHYIYRGQHSVILEHKGHAGVSNLPHVNRF